MTVRLVNHNVGALKRAELPDVNINTAACKEIFYLSSFFNFFKQQKGEGRE